MIVNKGVHLAENHVSEALNKKMHPELQAIYLWPQGQTN